LWNRSQRKWKSQKGAKKREKMSRVIVLNDTLTLSTSTGDQRKQTEGVRVEQRKNK